MKITFVAGIAVVVGSIVACAAKQTPPDQAAQAQAAGDIAGPPSPWKDMTGEERGAYMKNVVLPKMKDVFARFDAKHFADVTCATCHGENPKEAKFKMPSPKIPRLPADPAKFKEELAEHPEMADFMAKTVKPVMAALLGLPEYSQENPQGFGCGGCHVFE